MTKNPYKYDGRRIKKYQKSLWKCDEERRFPIKPSEIMIMVSWNFRGLGIPPKPWLSKFS
jgi:hypothetical protein